MIPVSEHRASQLLGGDSPAASQRAAASTPILEFLAEEEQPGGGGKQQFNIGDTVTQTVRLTNGWLTTPTAVANPFGADVGGLSSTKVKFTFASPVVGAGVSYPIRVDATIPGNADTASCWINGPGETTCTTDDLSIPANSPAGVYNINVKVTDGTAAPNTRTYTLSAPATKS